MFVPVLRGTVALPARLRCELSATLLAEVSHRSGRKWSASVVRTKHFPRLLSPPSVAAVPRRTAERRLSPQSAGSPTPKKRRNATTTCQTHLGAVFDATQNGFEREVPYRWY